MSRTIVVFHLPSSELVYLELGDLAGKPVDGSYVVLDGTRYKVSEPTESIGEFKTDSTRRSGIEKLFEIVAVMFNQDAVTLFKTLRNIGSGDQPEVRGGIIIPRATVIGDFDNVIVAKLENAGGKVSRTLLTQLHRAFASDADNGERAPAGDQTTSPAAPAIIVGDEAAE